MKVSISNKYEEKLKEMEEKLEKETVPNRKRQLEGKIAEYKRKHFPKVIISGKGNTYRHY